MELAENEIGLLQYTINKSPHQITVTKTNEN